MALQSINSARRPPTAPLFPRIQWKWFGLAIGGLALIYLALLNPYWVPSGDGDVYTAIGRSLAKGEGYRFNGVPCAIAPPGWPMLLALAMKVSPTFLFLKCVTIGCMLGSLAMTFFILRRFVSDLHSAGIVALTGVLAPLYPLTFWMHTEAFFCLLASGSILLALRISERVATAKNAYLVPEIVGMTLLLAGASFTRWPGFGHLLLVGAILLHGPVRQWLQARRLIALALATIACLGTFFATQHYLSLTPAEQRLAIDRGGAEERGDELTAVAISTTQPTTQDVTTQTSTAPTTASLIADSTDDDETPSVFTTKDAGNSKLGVFGQYLSRFAQAGRWFAWLLWYPTRFGQSVGLINGAALVLGWLVIVLLFFALLAGLRQRQWFWIGLALYTGGLILVWPQPNARYFVPVAPFILLGVVLGLQFLKIELQWSKWARPIGWLLPTFIASVIVTNVALLTIDIVVFRSGARFYQVYEGGQNEDLIVIARRLVESGSKRIAASQKYVNLGKTKNDSKFGTRALHLLTNDPIIAAPRKYGTRPNRDLNDWAGQKDINLNWYVFQAPSEPWRLWHFKLPRWIQAKLSKEKPGPPTGGWELYQWRKRQGLQSVDLPPLREEELPRRVPGM